MSSDIILYQPNLNVLPGTIGYQIEQRKYVRLACLNTGGNWDICLYADWSYLIDVYIIPSALYNWSFQFYCKVLLQIPKGKLLYATK